MSLSAELEQRFSYLEGLNEGWFGGDGVKISQDALGSARLFLEVTQLNWKIEPMVSGGVSLNSPESGDAPFVIMEFPARNGAEGSVLIIE